MGVRPAEVRGCEISVSDRTSQKSPPLPGSAIGGRTRGQPPPPGPRAWRAGARAGRGRRFQRPLGRLGWPPRPSDSPGTQGRPWGRWGLSGVRPGARAVAGFAIRRFCLIGNQHVCVWGEGGREWCRRGRARARRGGRRNAARGPESGRGRWLSRLTLRSGAVGYSDQHLSNSDGYGTQPTRVLDIQHAFF